MYRPLLTPGRTMRDVLPRGNGERRAACGRADACVTRVAPVGSAIIRRPSYHPGHLPVLLGVTMRHSSILLMALCLCSCGKKGPAPADDPAPSETAAVRPEVIPLLQFWDRTLNEHVYSYGDGQPAEYRRSGNFGNEKVVGYVATKEYPGTVRLVRAYCQDGKHYFTLNTPPATANDVVRIEAFIVYVWTSPGPGRVPVHACFLPDDKDPYFDTDLAKVKEYVDKTLKVINKQRKLVENYFYVYASGPASGAPSPSQASPQPAPSATPPAPKGKADDAELAAVRAKLVGKWSTKTGDFERTLELRGDGVAIWMDRTGSEQPQPKDDYTRRWEVVDRTILRERVSIPGMPNEAGLRHQILKLTDTELELRLVGFTSTPPTKYTRVK